ncbi:gliding motility-associated C-terminal domain-containing protein [Paracrocinitomix mangrovi]|uniref:PKD domain-containing protein n=1 Tax=Paracrocinitomix mangrovi TaxID=2862509 RepID=UPI001C8D895F|nr:PKD domain-containing protein [Paracrocinitomix mangrovi]UKN01908.1 gliding motility-associated C-terminal domain-containing protein [Paracrocinitomix mangrovi]
MKRVLFLLMFMNFYVSSNAQQLTNEGTNFYVAFPEVYDNSAAVFEINISSRQNATGTVEITGTGFSQNFNVVPGVVTTVTVPSGAADITIDETVLERAIHISSNNPVTVYASTFHSARSEASVCLPVSALGSSYMVTTYPNMLKSGVWYQSEFIVVAGDQSCDITIVPSCTTEGGVGAGTPMSVHLDPNDVYMVQAQSGSALDLTGTTVTADNGTDKFAVFNGHIWAYLSNCGNLNADPLYEQAYPIKAWGVEHILTISLEQDDNAYRVIAKDNGTTFTVDGVPTGGVLNSGDVYDGNFSNIDEAIMIESNHPVAVTQTMTTGVCSGNGDPSMIVINSNEQMYLDTVTFYAATGGSSLVNYVNVITRSDDTTLMEFNTAPITDWMPLTYDNTYSYKLFATGSGSHTLTTSGCGFLAYAYGMGNPESYFYAAGVRVNAVDDSLSITNINTSQQAQCDLDSIQFFPFTSGGDVVTYDWDFGDGDSSSLQDPIHVYANAGTYVVSLIVEYACFTDTIADTLVIFDSPDISGTFTDVSCYQYGDGAINTSTTGGSPNYSYSWSPNVGTTEDLTGLDGGTYTVTVTDANGCNDAETFVVDEPAPIDITIDPAGPFAPPDGPQNITASPAGGTWTATGCPGCITAGGVFDPAVAGPGLWEVCYTVTVGPCDSTECSQILVDTSCAMLAFTNEPTCYGFNDGSFTVNVSGGIGNITFLLTNSSGTQVNAGNSNTANNLSEGWYYININDDICVFDDSVYIGEPDEMVVDLNVLDVACNGDLSGMAIADTVLNYQGSYNSIAYFWNPAPPSGNGQGADTLSGVGAGTYNLQINDGNGCSLQMDFTISEPPALVFSQLGSDPAYCRVFDYQNGNGVVYAAATGGTPDYDYTWENVYTLQTTNNTTWGGLNPAVYKITVIDGNGCVLQEFITLDSLSPIADFDMSSPQFTAQWEGTSVVDVHFTNQSQYFANPNNPQADTTFFWNFDLGEGWLLSTDFFEEFDRSYIDSGTYNVCLVALNKNGCSDTACKEILVFDKPELVLPNVFTPGTDGSNDVFYFPYVGIAEFEAVIVNRWGITVFEFTDITQGWDGSDKNGSPCQDGVYFYKYQAVATNGTEYEGQGNIHLIRQK